MHSIGRRQRWAWLAAGLSAAIGACACGMSWLWVLAGGLTASLFDLYLDRCLRPCGLAAVLSASFGGLGRFLAVLTLIWTILVMAWTANLADAAFPMIDGFPILGWSLLALTAWGSWKGPATCARCAGVLFLFLTALYGLLAAFALPDVEWSNLRPAGPWEQSLWAMGLFLLPTGVWYSPCRRGERKPSWALFLLLPLLAALLAAVACGVLSPELAAVLDAPLYTVAQSVSLFGVMERMEPLLSAAMTMGVFCLLSSMACACRALANRKWTGPAACLLAALAMGPARRIPLPILTLGAILFWLLIPMITVLISRRLQSPSRRTPL